MLRLRYHINIKYYLILPMVVFFTVLRGQDIDDTIMERIYGKTFIEIEHVNTAIFHYIKYLEENIDTGIGKICLLEPNIQSNYFDNLSLENKMGIFETAIEQSRFNLYRLDKIRGLYIEDADEKIEFYELQLDELEKSFASGEVQDVVYFKRKADIRQKIDKEKKRKSNENETKLVAIANLAYLSVKVYDHDYYEIAIRIKITDRYRNSIYNGSLSKTFIVPFPTMLTKDPEIARKSPLIEVDPDKTRSPYSYLHTGGAYAKSGLLDKAYKMFRECEQYFPDEAISYLNWAIYYTVQNKKKEALYNLKKAVRLGYDNVEWLKTDTSMQNIRSEKAFKEIIKKLGKK